ncbi:protein of unassigned function [Methylobacterium oryzae CBMB20]|uniref:Protein of unassigned function n=1 Tax=Methylobacterium oryzae CBMB20 TaxID=693986 RepID=A0A089NPE9_9HYPH|nr:protein of unassigned function [Methylobacterium oryzae CBMB20]
MRKAVVRLSAHSAYTDRTIKAVRADICAPQQRTFIGRPTSSV